MSSSKESYFISDVDRILWLCVTFLWETGPQMALRVFKVAEPWSKHCSYLKQNWNMKSRGIISSQWFSFFFLSLVVHIKGNKLDSFPSSYKLLSGKVDLYRAVYWRRLTWNENILGIIEPPFIMSCSSSSTRGHWVTPEVTWMSQLPHFPVEP